MKIKSRIWIEADQGMLLGNGRVQLLRAITETGSLTKAAKSLEMSYKKAWNLIDSMNNNAPQEMVQTSTGGKAGGGAIVTEYGQKLMETFEKLNDEIVEFLNSKMKDLEL